MHRNIQIHGVPYFTSLPFCFPVLLQYTLVSLFKNIPILYLIQCDNYTSTTSDDIIQTTQKMWWWNDWKTEKQEINTFGVIVSCCPKMLACFPLWSFPYSNLVISTVGFWEVQSTFYFVLCSVFFFAHIWPLRPSSQRNLLS